MKASDSDEAPGPSDPLVSAPRLGPLPTPDFPEEEEVDPITLDPIDPNPRARFTFMGMTFNAFSFLEGLASTGSLRCPMTRVLLTEADLTALEKAAGLNYSERRAHYRAKEMMQAECQEVYTHLAGPAMEALHRIDSMLESRGPLGQEAHRGSVLGLLPSFEETLRNARARYHKAGLSIVGSSLPQFSTACEAVARFASDRFEDFQASAASIIQKGTVDPEAFETITALVRARAQEVPEYDRTYTLEQSLALMAEFARPDEDPGKAVDREALLWIVSPGEVLRMSEVSAAVSVAEAAAALPVPPPPLPRSALRSVPSSAATALGRDITTRAVPSRVATFNMTYNPIFRPRSPDPQDAKEDEDSEDEGEAKETSEEEPVGSSSQSEEEGGEEATFSTEEGSGGEEEEDEGTE